MRASQVWAATRGIQHNWGRLSGLGVSFDDMARRHPHFSCVPGQRGEHSMAVPHNPVVRA